jgi:hypothetical protein
VDAHLVPPGVLHDTVVALRHDGLRQVEVVEAGAEVFEEPGEAPRRYAGRRCRGVIRASRAAGADGRGGRARCGRVQAGAARLAGSGGGRACGYAVRAFRTRFTVGTIDGYGIPCRTLCSTLILDDVQALVGVLCQSNSGFFLS